MGIQQQQDTKPWSEIMPGGSASTDSMATSDSEIIRSSVPPNLSVAPVTSCTRSNDARRSVKNRIGIAMILDMDVEIAADDHRKTVDHEGLQYRVDFVVEKLRWLHEPGQ